MDETIALGACWPGAVAVSGGGDSIALWLLLVEWTRQHGHADPVALTVDHGLRPDSAAEAAGVAQRAVALGLPAYVLTWDGRKPRSDVEATARTARYRLMGAWCRNNGIRTLYVAHTMEDQAETFLLRLARGSGVDGLSAMEQVASFPVRGYGEHRVARPLLHVTRCSLRAWLASRRETWFEDPMNRNARFARARLRMEWPALEALGLTPQRVANAATHLARARAALEFQVESLLAEISTIGSNSAQVNADRLAAAPDEIALRGLACLLMRVSGRSYRPRFERLEHLLGAIRANALGGGRTLHGCCIKPDRALNRRLGGNTLLIALESARSSNEVHDAESQGDRAC